MKFIKLNDKHINVEHIASIGEDEKYYYIRLSNADAHRIEKKPNKKLIEGLLNADIQLPSKRTTERTDRNIQRPAK